ncbi:MAG: histidinol phosphatase [Bacilli bacterium]|nr:histidinol phosphatase [Bacilli bacterium]
MKIDLHCHTIKTKKSDGINRNVTVEDFSKYMKDLEIKIVAITNHNYFDLKQYNEFSESMKETTMVWPGIELDIKQKPKDGHMIVICDPKNKEEFSKIFDMPKDKADDYSIDIKTLGEKTKKLNCIYICHYYKKKPVINDDIILDIEKSGIDETRIFKEPSNYKTLGIFATFNNNVIIGSDVQDWNKYKECNFSNLKLDVDSFNQFLLLSKKEPTIITTLLNKKNKEKFNMKPHNSVSLSIELYEDINIIFGDKGTGKTEMLKSLEQSMINKNMNVVAYYGNEKDSEFDKLINRDDYFINDTKLFNEKVKDAFDYIYSWNDVDPTSLKDYIEWYETKDNNENKKSLKICDLLNLDVIDKKIYNKETDRLKKIDDFIEYINSDNSNYGLSDVEFIQLKDLLTKIQVNQSTFKKNAWIDKYSTDLVNYSIDKIKNITAMHSQSKSVPSETGISKFIKNRLCLKENIDIVLDYLNNTTDIVKEKYLGNLVDKGNIYKYTKFKLLDSNGEKSVASEFSTNKITDLREIKKILEICKENIYNDVLIQKIEELKTLDVIIKDGLEFVGVTKYVGIESGDVYKPSQGEKSMLLLNLKLNQDADNYILDEPELSLGNQYISSTIVPILNKLANARKRIVIATHNANIAVRTLPYLSILRTHNNGIYNTYLGNPFTNKLIDIDNENNILDWKEESLNILEGGEEAFEERSFVYEAGK